MFFFVPAGFFGVHGIELWVLVMCVQRLVLCVYLPGGACVCESEREGGGGSVATREKGKTLTGAGMLNAPLTATPPWKRVYRKVLWVGVFVENNQAPVLQHGEMTIAWKEQKYRVVKKISRGEAD